GPRNPRPRRDAPLSLLPSLSLRPPLSPAPPAPFYRPRCPFRLRPPRPAALSPSCLPRPFPRAPSALAPRLALAPQPRAFPASCHRRPRARVPSPCSPPRDPASRSGRPSLHCRGLRREGGQGAR
ncbi:hypothetical protein P7K49_027656, partial [Saguinus oedipus]